MRRARFALCFDAWRAAARGMLAERVPPAEIDWVPEGVEAQQSLLAAGAPSSAPRRACAESSAAAHAVPRRFVSLARRVACHRDPERWSLLYRVLWRLTAGGEPELLEIEVDPDVHRLTRMAKAVRRDLHKMKAFVRFRRVERDGEEWFIAWHRPDHLIVELAAPFFVERFNDQRWTILTPDASAQWDLERLEFGPGVPVTAAPDRDALEELWRTYYASIFNPARVNPKAMKAEMPVRHWATLPEATLLPELLRDAPRRRAAMIEAPRRRPARSWIDPGADLPALAAAIRRCEACALCTMGRPVFGEGPGDARLMLVGEQPGDHEERAGRPFVGPAGEVLDAALEAAGLDRGRLYLTNAVKHFKHEERSTGSGVRRIHKTPGLVEVRACSPWLLAEIRRVKPRGVVCLGATAVRSVIGPGLKLAEERGRLHRRDGGWALATYHPSAILRQPRAADRERLERLLAEDLALAARSLDAA